MIYDSIDVIGINLLSFFLSFCRCLFFEVFVSFDEQQQLMNFCEEQKKGTPFLWKKSLENIHLFFVPCTKFRLAERKRKEVEARDDEDDDENNTGEHIARERNRS